MADYTIYDFETGQILTSGSCSASFVESQLSGYPGAMMILEPSNPRTQRVVNGEVVDLPPRPGPTYVFDYLFGEWVESRTLQVAQNQAVKKINKAVGAARTRYITDLPGQDAIYAEKRLEALSYITQEPAQISEYDYPFLTNEVGVTAPTAYELSQLWLNLADMWKPLAARIEGVRLDAVYQIETAADVATVDAIVAAALTALEG